MIIPFEQILEQMALLLVWIQNWLPISIMLIKVISWSYLLLLVGILEELHMPAAKFWQEKLKPQIRGYFIERLRELTPNSFAYCLCFSLLCYEIFVLKPLKVLKQILEKLLKVWNFETKRVNQEEIAILHERSGTKSKYWLNEFFLFLFTVHMQMNSEFARLLFLSKFQTEEVLFLYCVWFISFLSIKFLRLVLNRHFRI